MNVLCPKCRRAIPVPENDPVLRCGRCNLVIDRFKVGLSPGLTSTPLTPDLRGETIGRYEIMDLVGLGGTGVVYRAKNTKNREIVAFKALHYDLLGKSHFVSRLRSEVKALARLNHPNLARLLDAGRKEDVYYLVTEFVGGVTLTHYLRSFQLGIPEICSIIGEICSAVTYAHNQGLVHGNLKPDNIILGQGTIKVLDFGIAHLAAGDSRVTTLDQPAAIMRTFNYMSPEQRTKTRPLDKRADIYSLGVILYEMLTQHLPLGAFNAPSNYKKGLDIKYDMIVLRALDPDPASRYQKVEDFMADITNPGKPRPAQNRAFFRLTLVLLACLSIAVYLTPEWPQLKKDIPGVLRQYSSLWDQIRGNLPERPFINKVKRIVRPPQPLDRPDKEEALRPRIEPELTPREIAPMAVSRTRTGLEPADKSSTHAGLNMTLYAEPSLESETVGRVNNSQDYKIVKERRTNMGQTWRLIQTGDGPAGWALKGKEK